MGSRGWHKLLKLRGTLKEVKEEEGHCVKLIIDHPREDPIQGLKITI